MRALFYIIGLGGALGINLFPSLHAPRPIYAKVLTILIITAVSFFAFYPPTVGNFGDAVRLKQGNASVQEINIILRSSDAVQKEQIADSLATQGLSPREHPYRAENGELVYVQYDASVEQLFSQHEGGLLLKIRNTDNHNRFEVVEVVSGIPSFYFPYILTLEERARIMYFHVPMSWVAMLAYAVTLMCSIWYLRTGKMEYEMKAASSAAIGTLFCVLAYVTGALWAKFNWGKFFNGDNREISVLVLLLIYGAYFALRASVEGEERRARLTSVYAIVACIAAVFLLFIVPRITQGLHPGSPGSENSGPIVSAKPDAVSNTIALIFSLSLTGFTMLYFWVLNLLIRFRIVEEKIQLRQEEEAIAQA